MEKPNRLRAALEAAFPRWKKDPSRLVIWIEDGAVRARQTETHGFAFQYPLSVLVTETKEDVALVAHAINRWLRVHQPDLLAGGNRESYSFETDILDNGRADILFTIPLCENVQGEEADGGGWTLNYLAEPDPLFADDAPLGDGSDGVRLSGHSVADIVED